MHSNFRLIMLVCVSVTILTSGCAQVAPAPLLNGDTAGTAVPAVVSDNGKTELPGGKTPDIFTATHDFGEQLFQQADAVTVESELLAKLAAEESLPTAIQVSEDTPVVYQDIPPGFDFPADEATLLRFRETQNVADMRRHAWYVWAGLTQAARGGEAIWETWFSSTETFTPTVPLQGLEDRNIQRNFGTPRQFVDMTGPSPQALGQSLLSFVLFNRAARAHIRGNNLHHQSTLTALNDQFTKSSTPPQDRRIPDFPRDAVVLKTVWWAVSGRPGELTAMPVWDFAPSNLNSDGNDFTTWQRVVAIDPARDNVPEGESTAISFVGVTMPDSRVVPLTRLYHFRLETQQQVEAANIGSTPNFSLGRDAQIGDYVALVALHYTTKEIPDWVWSTFWWHDKPDQGPYSMDRPTAVTGVWRNYLMDTAYDMVTPREFEGTPNAVYNPWLEAQFQNGMSSNCMTCHQRSVWRGFAVSFQPVTKGGLAPDDPYFEDALQLDFLWSIGYEAK